MKIRLTELLIAVALVAGVGLSAQGKPSDASMEALVAAPRNHKVLYEDDHVRIIEVTVQPGETENLHSHHYPSVFIYDAAQPKMRNRFADGTGWDYTRNLGGFSQQSEGLHLPARAKAAMARREADLPAALAAGWPAAMAMGPDTGPPHQVTNLDTFPHHFYRFEFKRIEGTSIMKRTVY